MVSDKRHYMRPVLLNREKTIWVNEYLRRLNLDHHHSNVEYAEAKYEEMRKANAAKMGNSDGE